MTPTSRSRNRRKPFAHQDQVGVVGDVAAGGAEVNDVAAPGQTSP